MANWRELAGVIDGRMIGRTAVTGAYDGFTVNVGIEAGERSHTGTSWRVFGRGPAYSYCIVIGTFLRGQPWYATHWPRERGWSLRATEPGLDRRLRDAGVSSLIEQFTPLVPTQPYTRIDFDPTRGLLVYRAAMTGQRDGTGDTGLHAETFRLHLDLLTRLARLNESVNTGEPRWLRYNPVRSSRRTAAISRPR